MNSNTIFFILIPILALLLLTINLLLGSSNPYKEKETPFECGIHSFIGQNRSQFTISFFIFALFFLVFDLEILSIFPFTISSSTNGLFGLGIVMIFIYLLGIGFAFELGKKALKFDISSTETKNTKKSASISYKISKQGFLRR